MNLSLLGNSDYNKNKGFSSDMYVKVSVNGKSVLDEISLKKDTTANIYNGVVTDIKKVGHQMFLLV